MHGIQVQPLDWLDPKWIKNTITDRLDAARGRTLKRTSFESMRWGRRIFLEKSSPSPNLFMRPNPPFPPMCAYRSLFTVFLARIALAVTRFQRGNHEKGRRRRRLTQQKRPATDRCYRRFCIFAKISSAQRHALGNRIALYETISVHCIFIRAYPPNNIFLWTV